MSSTWIDCVRAFYADYDSTVKMIEQGPMIKVTIRDATGPNYILTVCEDWIGVFAPNETHIVNINDILDWAEEALKNKTGCNRIAWNMWNFCDKTEAEKFKVLLIMKWQ